MRGRSWLVPCLSSTTKVNLMPFLLARPLWLVTTFSVIISIGMIGLTKYYRTEMRLARVALEQSETARAMEQEAHRITVAALEEKAKRTEATRARVAPIRKAITRAPTASVCTTSPPVRALVDGVRGKGATGAH